MIVSDESLNNQTFYNKNFNQNNKFYFLNDLSKIQYLLK